MKIVLVSMVAELVGDLEAALAELGHRVTAVVTVMVPNGGGGSAPLVKQVPRGVDLIGVQHTHMLAEVFGAYGPDAVLCWAFPWRVPPAALEVPRLGCVNLHPSLLPRHRGPAPLAWAVRAGDADIGVTWHRMVERFDSGPILAQAAFPLGDGSAEDVLSRVNGTGLALLPEVIDRLSARESGEQQDASGGTWAKNFTDDDYVHVDWCQTARYIHNQVRAWQLTFGYPPICAPLADLAGARVQILRTSLSDCGSGAIRMEAGDGPLWILEHRAID